MQISTETSGNTKVLPLDAQRKADSVDGKVRGASLRASYKENPRNFQWKSKEGACFFSFLFKFTYFVQDIVCFNFVLEW